MNEDKDLTISTGTCGDTAQLTDVDVVIVNYNSGVMLTRCVRALLASNVALRIFVSDNGSSDGSLEMLMDGFGSKPGLHVIENGKNLGFAGGNNAVLDRTQAAYLLFLNPDCFIEPGALRRMLAFMDATPSAGMSGCVIRNPDGSEQRSSRRRIMQPWSALVKLLRLDALWRFLRKDSGLDTRHQPLPTTPVEVEAISGSLMLVRRQALEVVGPLDEGYFLHCEDLDWFVRFRQAGWAIYLVPGAQATHHQGGCSRSSRIRVEWHKHRGMMRFYRKFQAEGHRWPFRILVFIGIWTHFSLLVIWLTVKQLFERVER